MELRKDILLSAADWQSRALILAELQELEYEVMAVPGVQYAINAALKGLIDPPLLIIDVFKDDSASPENVRGLLTLFRGRPAILLTPALDQARWHPLQSQVTRHFRRPIRIGDIIEAVQSILPPPATKSDGLMAR